MCTLIPIFKALSDRNRLRIVSALMKKEELCACQITELIRITGATASRHMSILISSGLVDSRKDGRWVYYRIRREQVDLHLLIDWIENQLRCDPDISQDEKTLDDITSCERRDLSRKQRHAKRCPKK